MSTPIVNNVLSVEFDSEISSKSSTQKELHCEICSKSFLSPNTYKHHMNSQKHKKNRKKIVEKPGSLSKSSSESEFSVLGLEKVTKCMFCNEWETKEHLKAKHNFPPFVAECIDIGELSKYVMKKIKDNHCVFCGLTFGNEESTKQHMMDLGHAKLNIDNFGEFEKFYLWRIEETSSEQEAELLDENTENINQTKAKAKRNKEEDFEDLGNPTLEMLEEQRQNRIKMTNIGAVINGKEVGTRNLKNYYKQYVGREYPDHKIHDGNQLCLENGPSSWKLAKRSNFGVSAIHTGRGR